MGDLQRTLKESVKISGIGLHTGEAVNLEICPAPENHGYKFQRIDLEDQPIIKADPENVVSTARGTTLEQNGGKVILAKTQISPEMGYFALYMDSEGNKLGLHSSN